MIVERAAILMLVMSACVTEGAGDSLVLRSPADVPVYVLLLFVVGSAALYWRRQAPVAVLAVVLAAWALTLGSGDSDLGWQALVAVYGVGRYGSAERWGHVGVDAALVVVVLHGVTGDMPWGEVAFGVVVFFTIWYVGRRLRRGGPAGPARTPGGSAGGRSGRGRAARRGWSQ